MATKIIFKGSNPKTGEPFCIIKQGTYPLTKEGLLQALASGYMDKQGEFSPEFTFTRFSVDKRKKGKFYCRINQLHDGKNSRICSIYDVSIRCIQV